MFTCRFVSNRWIFSKKIRSTDRLWNLLSNLLMTSLACKEIEKVKEWGLNWGLVGFRSRRGQAQLMVGKGAWLAPLDPVTMCPGSLAGSQGWGFLTWSRYSLSIFSMLIMIKLSTNSIRAASFSSRWHSESISSEEKLPPSENSLKVIWDK